MQPRLYHLRGEESTDGASLWTIDNWYDKESSDALLASWQSPEASLVTEPTFSMYGKPCTMWRRMGFFSDVSGGYKFAKQKQIAQRLPDDLRVFLTRMNETCNTNFNGVLVNHYRDGQDYISPHSDDEKELSRGAVGCLSVGAERWFAIYDKKTNKEILRVRTGHGQLLVMDGEFQKKYKHAVLVEKGCDSSRVSFTGREHK